MSFIGLPPGEGIRKYFQVRNLLKELAHYAHFLFLDIFASLDYLYSDWMQIQADIKCFWNDKTNLEMRRESFLRPLFVEIASCS